MRMSLVPAVMWISIAPRSSDSISGAGPLSLAVPAVMCRPLVEHTWTSPPRASFTAAV